MIQSVGVSPRSILTAGFSAALVGAAVLTPVAAPDSVRIASSIVRVSAPDIQLTTAGDTIIAAYTALQPWVAYGFELLDYALVWVPFVSLIAPAIDLAYFTAQPLIEAGVYSFAALIDGNWTLIGPIVQTGIQNAVANFIEYGIAWIGSIIPLPPLPPILAATKARAAAPRATNRVPAAAAVPEQEVATAQAVSGPATETETAAIPRSRRDVARAQHSGRPASVTTATAASASRTADPAASASRSADPAAATHQKSRRSR